MEIGLNLKAVYDDGTIYEKSVLEFDEEKLLNDINVGMKEYKKIPGLVYKNEGGVQEDSVKALGEDKIKTATFFIKAYASDTNFDHDFDFILESEEEVPVSFVRVIKTENDEK